MPTDNTEKYSLKLTTKAGDTYRGNDVAVSVNKEGLTVRRDEYNQIYITANCVGTYKVTFSLMDGNSTKKTYTVKAW